MADFVLRCSVSSGSKEKAIKHCALTKMEIGRTPDGTRMYQGVGRAFVLTDKPATLARLDAETAENQGGIKQLADQKAVLEKRFKEMEGGLRDMLRNR